MSNPIITKDPTGLWDIRDELTITVALTQLEYSNNTSLDLVHLRE